MTEESPAGVRRSSLRANFAAAVDVGRVELLFGQSLARCLATFTIASLALGVLWGETERLPLACWYAALIVVSLARLALWQRYRRCPTAASPQTWENAFAIGAAATGVLWGALAIVLQPQHNVQAIFVAFLIGGMTMSATAFLGASRKAFIAFVAPMLVALTLGFLQLGGRLHLAMAALLLVFLLAALRATQGLHRTVLENIARGIEIDRLVAEQRGLLDAATVGIAFVKDHKMLDCNAELGRILGRPRSELLGASTRLWYADEASWERGWRAAHHAQRTDGSYHAELQLARSDGSLVWCNISSRSIAPGEPERGQVVVCADISERKATEAALHASTERIALVMRATQSGLWDWEIGTGRRHVSERFKEILGYAPELDLVRTFHLPDRLHPEDGPRVLSAIDSALAGRKPFDEEARLRRADESWVWVHGRAEVTRDDAGKPQRFTGSITDISDRRSIEEKLRHSESHFRHLVETANDLVWAVGRDGRWTYLSPRATRQIFGCEPEDMIGTKLTASQIPEEHARTEAMIARVLDDGTASHFGMVHLNLKGERVMLSFNATPLRAPSGAITGVTGTATDITPLKTKENELSAALAEQELIFESTSEGLVFLKNRIVHRANGKFAAMFGYETRELIGQPSVLWYAQPQEWDAVGREMEATLGRGQVSESERLVKRKNGETFWCEVRGRAVRADDPTAGSIWVYIDISARKEREQRIQHLADHDALTGLLNRRLLEDRLRQAISMARREDKLAAIMLVDLDAFKQINDGYGHLTGDYVLRTVAKRLKDCVRESDTVARLGGDEFVVLLTAQKSTEDAALVAEKILSSLTLPIAAGGRDFHIGASIGISIFPRDGQTPDALIKHADSAMYRVKEAGKNRYEFYSSEKQAGVRRQR